MRNYVIINGVNSLTIQGLAIKTLPPITKPIQRNLREEIDGRDGDIVTTLGYGAYDKTIEIGLFGTFDIDEVIAYFNQKGTITFSNEADKVYYFEALDQVDYAELLKFRTANVVLHCQPFKYPLNETPLVEEYEYVEATGTNVTLDNTSEAIFNKIDLLGNTEQKTIEGINKFNKDGNLSTFQAGGNQAQVTKTNEKITFVTTGQNAAGFYITSSIWHNYVDNFDSTKTYTISADITLSAEAQLKFGVESNATFQTYSGKRRITNTTNASSINSAIVVYLYNNTIGTQVTVENIQIEEGTTAHDFVPYVGSLTSPNFLYPQSIRRVRGDNEIAICGRNLFNKDTISERTYLQPDGTLYTEATADYNTSDFIAVRPNTTYYKTETLSPRTKYYDRNKRPLNTTTYQDIPIGGSAGSFTTPNNAYYLRMTINISTEQSKLDKVMLSLGSTRPTYEAYDGQTFPLTLGEKNLWTNQITGWLPTSGAYPTTNSQYPNARYVLIDLLEGESITISGSTSINGRIRYIDALTNQVIGAVTAVENDYFISTTAGIAQFTEGTITAKKEVILGVLDIQGNINDVVVNYGNSVQTISDNPIQMLYVPNSTYKDVFVKENGTWYKREMMGSLTLTGNETGWTRSGASTTDYFVAAFNFIVNNIRTKFQTSELWKVSRFVFGGLGRDGTYLGYNGDAEMGQQLIGFTIKSSIANTIEDFKAWISSHQIDITYVKRDVEDIEITGTLANQLEAIKNAISYKGQTNISQTNNDLPFILDLSALKENSDHLVIDNIGNIYSKPTLDLEGTGIVDIYLNDTQMFEVDLSEKNEIVIDTQAMEAYNPTDNTLANRQVTGDYSKFKLESGENDLRFSGALTKATITNYERWL